MTASFKKQDVPVIRQKNFSRFRGPMPDRSFVRYKEPGGPESIWRRTPSAELTTVSVIIPTADDYRNGFLPEFIDQLSEPELMPS